DRLLEELHVHLESDGLDVTALLAAKQIPGAANLEIERGHAESAAEIAELLDRGQPLLRDRRQVVFRRNQQIGVRRTIGAPDASAELIELREAVAIRAIDDDRVRVGNVEPVLHDRRRQQDVELSRDEIEHGPLEHLFFHLAVADDDARLGHQSLYEVPDREDRFDAIVDEIHLAAARELVAYGAPDHLLIELDD